MQNLKAKTIRGSVARVFAQGAGFILRMGSLMILARLLDPSDFGLVGMVTAFTGILGLLRDFGLSTAAIQYATVTEEQISTLFWINLLLGVALGVIVLVMAPFVAAFYHESQLLGVTAAVGTGFVFNGAGIQHSAILQREMRFTALAVINVIALAVGIAIAIYVAKAGYGYWALVLMTVAPSLIATIGFWLTTGWVPGRPRTGVAGIRSMVRFGGGVTLTGLIAYMAYNAEKVMIGRYWGASALGTYGRGWQIVFIPTDNLNSAISEVAFSALSRLQDDPIRLRNYFLKGLSLFLGLMVPISIACGLFADDIVLVILGPKWTDAIAIVRLLAPTIAIFAIINPLGWLIFSIGLVGRALKITPVLAAIMITGFAIALPHGPKAMAFAYSAVLALWTIPQIWLCVRGTMVSVRDILAAASRPLASGIFAGVVAFAARGMFSQFTSPWCRLFLESGVLFAVFFGVLLFVAGQKSLYLDLLGGLKRPPSTA
jgi:O-antigen/teichoic acid export membrane protein